MTDVSLAETARKFSKMHSHTKKVLALNGLKVCVSFCVLSFVQNILIVAVLYRSACVKDGWAWHAAIQNDEDSENNNAVSVKLYIYLLLIVSGLSICVCI
jgi:ABC-type transport system involved in Fe-S cluster assembly fused permease/ATPase subunit